MTNCQQCGSENITPDVVVDGVQVFECENGHRTGLITEKLKKVA